MSATFIPLGSVADYLANDSNWEQVPSNTLVIPSVWNPNPGPVSPSGGAQYQFLPILACDDDVDCACIAHDRTTGFFIILSICNYPSGGCLTGLDGACAGSGPGGSCVPCGQGLGACDTGCDCQLDAQGNLRQVIAGGNCATNQNCQGLADALQGKPINQAFPPWFTNQIDLTGEAVLDIDYWFVSCYDPPIIIPIPSCPLVCLPQETLDLVNCRCVLPVTKPPPCCTSYSFYDPACCIPCSVQPCAT